MTNEERAILLWRQLRFDACDRDPLRIIEAALDEAQREGKAVRDALQAILEIGKRNTENPKYDGYYETAREAVRDFDALATRGSNKLWRISQAVKQQRGKKELEQFFNYVKSIVEEAE